MIPELLIFLPKPFLNAPAVTFFTPASSAPPVPPGADGMEEAVVLPPATELMFDETDVSPTPLVLPFKVVGGAPAPR